MRVIPSRVFVEAVMERLGAEQKVDLAKKMGWGHQAPGSIGRWLKGSSAPNYESTMEMLAKCGWLNMDADAPAPAQTAPDPLEGLAAKIAELARGQAQIAAALGVELRPDGPSEAREKPPQVRPKRRKTG